MTRTLLPITASQLREAGVMDEFLEMRQIPALPSRIAPDFEFHLTQIECAQLWPESQNMAALYFGGVAPDEFHHAPHKYTPCPPYHCPKFVGPHCGKCGESRFVHFVMWLTRIFHP